MTTDETRYNDLLLVVDFGMVSNTINFEIRNDLRVKFYPQVPMHLLQERTLCYTDRLHPISGFYTLHTFFQSFSTVLKRECIK